MDSEGGPESGTQVSFWLAGKACAPTRVITNHDVWSVSQWLRVVKWAVGHAHGEQAMEALREETPEEAPAPAQPLPLPFTTRLPFFSNSGRRTCFAL
jgi:hypothetical protein